MSGKLNLMCAKLQWKSGVKIDFDKKALPTFRNKVNRNRSWGAKNKSFRDAEWRAWGGLSAVSSLGLFDMLFSDKNGKKLRQQLPRKINHENWKCVERPNERAKRRAQQTSTSSVSRDVKPFASVLYCFVVSFPSTFIAFLCCVLLISSKTKNTKNWGRLPGATACLFIFRSSRLG